MGWSSNCRLFRQYFELGTDYDPKDNLREAFHLAGWKPVKCFQLPIKTRVFFDKDGRVCVNDVYRAFPADLKGVGEMIEWTCVIPNWDELDLMQSFAGLVCKN